MGSEKAINQSSDPNFKINVNNPETIEGTHVSLQGEITFGIQFREGVKFLGIGEKIDAGIHKVIADAELLWSVKTGFILNINFPENYKEFIDQEHIARFGYSNLGFGGEISGAYSGGKVSDLESMGHVGPINLTLSKRMHNLSFEVISGAHTIGLFSFSGSLTINNINTSGMEKGTAADGMALSKTRRDAYLRMMQHNRYSNDGAADKLRMKMRFEAALRKLNRKK